MTRTFSYTFSTPSYQDAVSFNTGLFINGEWVDPVDSAAIDIVNPTTGELIISVAAGSSKDVDIAVEAAKQAYTTSWGLKCPGSVRGKLLNKLADLVEQHSDEFAALEALNVDENRLAYTRREPFGVVGLIVPWNFPLMMAVTKIAPALATGNAVVFKPSEVTPLTALKLAGLFNEAGFPPGVINIINGYGNTVGQAISEHPFIQKVAFTGSTLVGRKVLKSAAESNLKNVALELGGKSPTVIFHDANLEQAVKWAAHGIFFNMGQACTAGSRIFVQETIYDEFLDKFTTIAKYLHAATGDPFTPGIEHGPQVSQTQFERVMGYIESGKSEGATIHIGGARQGSAGYFIQPTIFTDVKPDMKIVNEEIFGPVACVIKFKTEKEVIEAANNTIYGLACNVFSENLGRALRVAHSIEAGTAWVNCSQLPEVALPFGGYKQSGIGRELGQYALDMYTQVKAVHVNLGLQL
ncbi:Aldehyde dehydrogenase [Hypsizygus marmoreus]|uniref:Aldehyde dehydrogenase n=1 Tax=Hypsizygus marmoreus TaxID=39966 RepID=A0A369K1H8_HYPMA|nr:Aldehyde dehydrogenase [Hypsizygus marmoreus]